MLEKFHVCFESSLWLVQDHFKVGGQLDIIMFKTRAYSLRTVAIKCLRFSSLLSEEYNKDFMATLEAHELLP